MPEGQRGPPKGALARKPPPQPSPVFGGGNWRLYQTLPERPGLVMAPSLAEATLLAYLANTPVV